jgi:hypothetical protein
MAEFRVVLPCCADEYENRLYASFLKAAIHCRQVKLVECEAFVDEDAEDSRLEEGFRRRFRIQTSIPSVLGVLLGSLSSCTFDVEEKVSFPFSKTRWWCASLGLDVEVQTMVIDEDRGDHVNALAYAGGEREIDFVDLGEEVDSGCMFEAVGATMKPFDFDLCEPVCCVYVLATVKVASVSLLQAQVEARVLRWLVREPLMALCKRVVVGLDEPCGVNDWKELERMLHESVMVVSSPVRTKKVECSSLDAALAAELQSLTIVDTGKRASAVEPVIPESKEESVKTTDPSQSVETRTVRVSVPLNVKKLEDLNKLDFELAEEILKIRGPPPCDVVDADLHAVRHSPPPSLPPREVIKEPELDSLVMDSPRDFSEDDLFAFVNAPVPNLPRHDYEDESALEAVFLSDSSPPATPPRQPLPKLNTGRKSGATPLSPSTINLAALPPPPVLPETVGHLLCVLWFLLFTAVAKVRATSPRSSQVLASNDLPSSIVSLSISASSILTLSGSAKVSCSCFSSLLLKKRTQKQRMFPGRVDQALLAC